MSAAAAGGRVGRFYTAARRHPWVLGKVADWRIPLGPYTPAQIAVAVGGGFVLVKSIGWWSWMGPVPVAAWLLAIWAVRRPRIAGRAPLQAAWGWALLVWQPRGGRIGGRAARDRRARPLLGGFTIEDAPAPRPAAAPKPSRARRRAGRVPRPSPAAVRTCACQCTEPAAPAATVEAVGPVSGVQQLFALAGQGGVR
ncbi:hypothetical protein ACFZAD_35145 [Streptomyces iakyrus]|uniref:hypothetical protein n=1 Tax=Streptomyces iakyrus TaxID=68219 RepID=UPI0036E938D3